MTQTNVDTSPLTLDSLQLSESVFESISSSNLELLSQHVQFLKDSEISLDSIKSEGYSLLHHACLKGFKEGVQLLCESGAPIDEKSVDIMYTPLVCTCIRGEIECAKVLLEKGADVNMPTSSVYNTPIFYASSRGFGELTLLLLNHGANPDIQDKNGNTPLHHACSKGLKEAAFKLITSHPQLLKVANKEGELPIHSAAMGGDLEVLTKILTPETLHVFSTPKSGPGLTPLHFASRRGWTEGVKELLARGADVNPGNGLPEYMCVSDAAADVPTTPLGLAVTGRHWPVVRLLLCNGAGVDYELKNYPHPCSTLAEMPLALLHILKTHPKSAVRAGVCSVLAQLASGDIPPKLKDEVIEGLIYCLHHEGELVRNAAAEALAVVSGGDLGHNQRHSVIKALITCFNRASSHARCQMAAVLATIATQDIGPEPKLLIINCFIAVLDDKRAKLLNDRGMLRAVERVLTSLGVNYKAEKAAKLLKTAAKELASRM